MIVHNIIVSLIINYHTAAKAFVKLKNLLVTNTQIYLHVYLILIIINVFGTKLHQYVLIFNVLHIKQMIINIITLSVNILIKIVSLMNMKQDVYKN